MNQARCTNSFYRLKGLRALGCTIALLSLLGLEKALAHCDPKGKAAHAAPARSYILLYSTFSDIRPIEICGRRIGRSKIRQTIAGDVAFVSKAEFRFLDSVFQQPVHKWGSEWDWQKHSKDSQIMFQFGKKTGTSRFLAPDIPVAASVLAHIRKVVDNDTTHLSSQSKKYVTEVLSNFMYRIGS